VSRQKELLEKNVALKTKELQKKSQKLKHQAEHDSLTHLPNRFLFLDRLKQALKQAQREQQVVSVLFLDLDRFKEINDTYGHDVGDKLLQLVTKRLLRARRKEDTVARLGGDEFTILLQDVSQNSVIHIVNKIIESMQEPFIINGMKHYTTFSIGISSYPDDADNAEDLLRNADTAMYKAKESGKNRYYFYHAEMTKLAFERIELEKELRRALENDEFEAYFQPKIDAKQHKVTGLEALIRWQHPIKGMIFPDKFIPFAEEIGLIGAIDDVMMRLSIQQVLEWHRKGIECGKISINLSARQLTSKNYIQELEETINDIGLDTRYIEIEITETHIMENPQHAMDILNKIRALGISISIDDFGTGYSSLSYLKKLPVTKLKIDRSFVMELPYDKDDVAIVKTIISLAKNLDLEIIAEGVEEKAQVDFLVREGCDNIQGYYFSKPLSKEDCEKFLKTFE
jgi:diguanylate cyclase (GGDEF)-like protein